MYAYIRWLFVYDGSVETGCLRVECQNQLQGSRTNLQFHNKLTHASTEVHLADVLYVKVTIHHSQSNTTDMDLFWFEEGLRVELGINLVPRQGNYPPLAHMIPPDRETKTQHKETELENS